ncbi:MAG: hypothetical protein M0Z95_20505 [Actinomycetota bacterium]|jgi:hypothetical protein|nr:hypothetical protein [Actinomycetota bacterium]
MKKHIAKLVATAALGSTLALGAAGVAGATTGGPAVAKPATPPKICAKAPALIKRLESLNTRYDAWLPKAEHREAVAKADHRTREATRIQDRIKRLGALQAKAANLAKDVQAFCHLPASAAGSKSQG